MGSETTVGGGGSDVAAVLACTFGVLLAFLLLFVEVVVVVVVVLAPAACLATETAAEEAGVAAADEAVEPGTIWRVGVAWRADGGRVAGVFGVGVCCRPERRPAATSGSTVVAVVFEVTMVLEFTDVVPELGVTMELMTVVAEVAVAVVLAELLTAVELLDLPLVLVLTLSTRIDFFAVEITWVSSSPSVCLLLAMTAAVEPPLTFLAFAGVEVPPFLLSAAVILAFLLEVAVAAAVEAAVVVPDEVAE